MSAGVIPMCSSHNLIVGRRKWAGRRKGLFGWEPLAKAQFSIRHFWAWPSIPAWACLLWAAFSSIEIKASPSPLWPNWFGRGEMRAALNGNLYSEIWNDAVFLFQGFSHAAKSTRSTRMEMEFQKTWTTPVMPRLIIDYSFNGSMRGDANKTTLWRATVLEFLCLFVCFTSFPNLIMSAKEASTFVCENSNQNNKAEGHSLVISGSVCMDLRHGQGGGTTCGLRGAQCSVGINKDKNHAQKLNINHFTGLLHDIMILISNSL